MLIELRALYMQVFNLPPTDKKYLEIARITDRTGRSMASSKDLNAMLPPSKEKACELGADAIVLTNVHEGSGSLLFGGSAGEITAIAIRWR